MNQNCSVIHRYTRREAIADGVLIDVTETALEAGFKIPVAITSSVWAAYVVVPNNVDGQDERGRLWDALMMLRFAIRSSNGSGANLRYRLYVRNDNREGDSPPVELKAVCGPNDDGTPCITVMLPEED